jgi:leader peptidase (prepilin peptidase)/N-methyltransferase
MADRRTVDLTLLLAVLGTALLALAVLATAADLRAALLGVTLVAVVVPATWIDLDRRLIPNRLTAAGALAAIAVGAATEPAGLPVQLLWGALAGGFLLTAALVRPDGMGMGDVKLAGVLGLLLGPAVAVALPLALASAALAGLAIAVRGARGASATARGADAGDAASVWRAARTATLPFGPFLALGAIVAWFAGDAALAAYLG